MTRSDTPPICPKNTIPPSVPPLFQTKRLILATFTTRVCLTHYRSWVLELASSSAISAAASLLARLFITLLGAAHSDSYHHRRGFLTKPTPLEHQLCRIFCLRPYSFTAAYNSKEVDNLPQRLAHSGCRARLRRFPFALVGRCELPLNTWRHKTQIRSALNDPSQELDTVVSRPR